jgi:4-hydroxyphenylpyruvate dioxygenase-like putative hemolysin
MKQYALDADCLSLPPPHLRDEGIAFARVDHAHSAAMSATLYNFSRAIRNLSDLSPRNILSIESHQTLVESQARSALFPLLASLQQQKTAHSLFSLS